MSCEPSGRRGDVVGRVWPRVNNSDSPASITFFDALHLFMPWCSRYRSYPSIPGSRTVEHMWAELVPHSISAARQQRLARQTWGNNVAESRLLAKGSAPSWLLTTAVSSRKRVEEILETAEVLNSVLEVLRIVITFRFRGPVKQVSWPVIIATTNILSYPDDCTDQVLQAWTSCLLFQVLLGVSLASE